MTRYGEVATGHIGGTDATRALHILEAMLGASDTRGDITESVSAPAERDPEDPDHIERRETAMRVRQEASFS